MNNRMTFGYVGRLLKKRVAVLATLALAAASFAESAFAVCSKWGGDTHSFTIPSARIVANSADVGESLGAWVVSSRSEILACGSSNSYPHYNRYDGAFTEVSTYTEGRQTYGVVDTGIPGIGMVFAVEIRSGGELVPLRNGPSKLYNIGEHYYPDQAIWVKFIKTGATSSGTYSISSRPILTMNHFQVDLTVPKFDQSHSIEVSTVEVVHIPLCHVQSKNVYLGVATLNQFPRVNAAAPAVEYSVEMNCEAGAGRVKYYLEEAGSAVVNRLTGMLEVSGGAEGFVLQLLDGNGSPVEIYRSYQFGSSSNEGLRSERFSARYVRTAPTAALMKAGPANAQIRYRVDYP